MEQQLTEAQTGAQQQHALVQDSLRREHAATVEQLQRDIAAIQSDSRATQESLRCAHEAEVRRLQVELESWRRQQEQRVTSSVQVRFRVLRSWFRYILYQVKYISNLPSGAIYLKINDLIFYFKIFCSNLSVMETNFIHLFAKQLYILIHVCLT